MSNSAPTTRQVFIGRQAIFDEQRQVAAYELLYRHNDQTDSAQRGDRNATSVVMVDALMSIGFERLVGAHRAFLNMDTASLLAELPLSLPPQRVVIEVLETVALKDLAAAVEKAVSPTPETFKILIYP